MMRRRLRISFVLFLSLVLFGTSMDMAVARGQVRVAGQIVICSGYGLTTIYVDENGREVPKVHICPDCVLAMMAAVAPAPIAVFRPETRARRLMPPPGRRLPSRAVPFFRARDPPVPV